MHRKFAPIALLSALLASPLAMAGPVNSYAFNRVFVFADALTQFIGPTTVLTDAPPSGFGIVDTPDLSQTFSATSSLVPFTGAAKDGAYGVAAVTGLLRSGTAADEFSFSFSGVASAENAFAAPGEPASAFVDLNASFGFHIDAFGPAAPAGSLVGTLDIGALRAATEYETFAVEVSSLGMGVFRTIGPGAAATGIPILSGDTYTVTLSYQMRVPFGVDPEFDLTVGASIGKPVPEPMTYALFSVGLVGVMLARRRRR